jgi:hypothetical protein
VRQPLWCLQVSWLCSESPAAEANDGTDSHSGQTAVRNGLGLSEHDLPPSPAKRTDARASAFVEKHGDVSVELGALAPNVLHGLVRDSIDAPMDLPALEAEQDTVADERTRFAAVIDGIGG